MIHATVIGNLGSDAELRTTPAGKVVCNFRIAARGRDKDAPATWVRCALWGARGEKVSQYLVKGGRVAVSGVLSTSEYNGKLQLDLDVGELELLGDKRPEEPVQRREPARQSRAMPPARPSDDEEIPF